jgi:hypothetical protein
MREPALGWYSGVMAKYLAYEKVCQAADRISPRLTLPDNTYFLLSAFARFSTTY